MKVQTMAGREVLIIGADLVMPKLFYFGEELGKLGYRYAIYTHDVTPESQAIVDRAGARLLPGPPHRKSIWRMLVDIFRMVRTVRRRDFHHADLYCDYHILAAYAYLLILLAKRIPVVLWCRGELYDWAVFAWWQKLFFHVAMRTAKLVILKEPYMVGTLQGAGIYRPEKSIEIHNTVPVDGWRRTRRANPAKLQLLYLNSFKTWRRVDFCVDVAAALREKNIDFDMTIVGDSAASPGLIAEGRNLRDKIDRMSLGDRVRIEPFTYEPRQYYTDHDIFLLPADDLIFCNYALLEAMRDGLVPIVNNRDVNYNRIIEDGVSGYGCPLDAQLWAEKISAIVHESERFSAMSAAAEKRIRDSFSAAYMFDLIARRSGLKPA